MKVKSLAISRRLFWRRGAEVEAMLVSTRESIDAFVAGLVRSESVERCDSHSDSPRG